MSTELGVFRLGSDLLVAFSFSRGATQFLRGARRRTGRREDESTSPWSSLWHLFSGWRDESFEMGGKAEHLGLGTEKRCGGGLAFNCSLTSAHIIPNQDYANGKQ